MNEKDPFCTCGDTRCPNHPCNHDQGCTLCIKKNRDLGEIPSCFFKLVDPDYQGPTYFYKDFAQLVLKK